MLPPININKWIQDNKHLLQPPVGAQLLYTDKDSTFVVMIVGGPNQRTDYHVNETDEFFYQFQGEMVLKIVDKDGTFKDISIKEGETFILPSNTPHSPQRYKDTIGLVIEKKRSPENIDHLQWYCDSCKKLLFKRSFHVDDLDLGKQLTPVIQEFYGNTENRICKQCNHASEKPKVNDYLSS